MANTYTLATITPSFPKTAIEEIEIYLLSRMGFDYEFHGENICLFTEDGLMGDVELEDTDVRRFHAVLKTEPYRSRTEWHGAIEKAIADMEKDEEFNPPYVIPTQIGNTTLFVPILQAILNRLPETKYRHFDFKGAYYCSKLRPGSAGGYMTRIYRDAVVSIDPEDVIPKLARLAASIKVMTTDATISSDTRKDLESVELEIGTIVPDWETHAQYANG